MPGKLKIEIVAGENVLEIYESEPGVLSFVMYPDSAEVDTILDITIPTEEFIALLRRLIDYA